MARSVPKRRWRDELRLYQWTKENEGKACHRDGGRTAQGGISSPFRVCGVFFFFFFFPFLSFSSLLSRPICQKNYKTTFSISIGPEPAPAENVPRKAERARQPRPSSSTYRHACIGEGITLLYLGSPIRHYLPPRKNNKRRRPYDRWACGAPPTGTRDITKPRIPADPRRH